MFEEHDHEETVLEVKEVEVIVIELVDIEEYAKRGERPSRARQYKFRVDDRYYTTPKAELTGREILAFTGKTPETYQLRERRRGGIVVAIAPDEIVDLRGHGVERFMTIPKENTDGGNLHEQ